MSRNNVLNTMSQNKQTETRFTKSEFGVISAAKNEKLKTTADIPTVNIGPCEDSILYATPRRTEVMLQPPLHRVMFDQDSKNMRRTPRLTHSGANRQCKESKITYSEQRRSGELFKSPLHRDVRSTAVRLDKESPRRSKLAQDVSKKLSRELCATCLAPRLPLEELENIPSESPQHRDLDVSSEESKHIYSEPRRIMEMLQSPLHKDMRSSFIIHPAEPSERIHSEPRRTTELLYSACLRKNGQVKRKLQFDKQNMDKLLERIETHLQQITAFQDISKRKLQQLGVQDFISIIGYLLSHTGVPIKALEKSNYMEQIIEAMKKLNYPHTVRKSWLLMPNASLQHLVQLFDFLLDFAPAKLNEIEFDFKTQFDKEQFAANAERWRQDKGQHKIAGCNRKNYSLVGDN